MKPVKRLTPVKAAKLGGKPSRLGVGIMRSELAFVPPSHDPLPADVSDDPEVAHQEVIGGVKHAFYERMKQERAQFDELTRTDFYFVVCFQHGTQANAFLQAVGYPNATASYVDGTILAEKLGIDLPPSPVKFKPPRLPDKALSRLVSGFQATAARVRSRL